MGYLSDGFVVVAGVADQLPAVWTEMSAWQAHYIESVAERSGEPHVPHDFEARCSCGKMITADSIEELQRLASEHTGYVSAS